MQPVTIDLVDAQTADPLFARLRALDIPGNKTEQYRHFKIKPILTQQYALLEPYEGTPETGEKLIIENGALIEVPKGVAVRLVEDSLADSTHFDALYFLNHLLSPRTIEVTFETDAAIELVHRFDLAQALLPYRLVILVGQNSNASVFERFECSGSDQSLLLYGIDAIVKDDATLKWVRSQSGSASHSTVIGTHRFDIHKEGALSLKTFDFGSMNALHLYKVDLREYAWCDAAHLVYATKAARRGNVVAINHDRPYAKSAQDARTILKDKATGIFDGKVRIGHEARYASAHQNSKAVLLDDHAFMYAKPQLEIYTDELEASHGSTTGTLDEDTLFYLRSRGIAEEEAQKMLVLAFADALIDSIGDDALSQRVHTDFESAYFSS